MQSRNLRAGRARAQPGLRACLTALIGLLAATALLPFGTERAGAFVQKRWVYVKQKERFYRRQDREISAKEGRNPLFRYFKPDYADSLLDRIRKDTGDEVPGDAIIFALKTRRLKEASVFIVKNKGNEGCGDRYDIFKRTNRKFTELFTLRCVDGVYLTRKKSTTNGLPDLVYTSRQHPGEIYSTTFRFDGDTYVEHECQVGKPDTTRPNITLYEAVECKGRGIVRR